MMNNARESQSYFARASDSTAFKSGGILGKGLYKCQEGAICAIVAHFSTTDEAAIISMPTGSGKTELMIAICFVLKPRRVLVLEPAQHLREQTKERFSELKIFRDKGIVPESMEGPTALEVKTLRSSPDRWEELWPCDVVVATPQTVSPAIEGVDAPLDGKLFDLILVDEGHHSAANTWVSALNAFSEARTIHLTATPFRRDRRKIPGKLVYHYPLGRALADEIYRPVKFIPSPFRNSDVQRELELIRVAAQQIIQERTNGGRAIIRVDRIDDADRLVPLYQAAGIGCVAVHSKLSRAEQKSRLKKLESGENDAVICVGMLGEGLDLPALKIAVLHSPPQTLPQTLQLVGRVSRTTAGQEGDAFLIANPETVQGQVRRLYQENVDWAKFVPELVRHILHHEYGDRLDLQVESHDEFPVLPEHLEPFRSVILYQPFNPDITLEDRAPDLSNLANISGLPRVVENAYKLRVERRDVLVIVTEKIERPPWSKKSGTYNQIYNQVYDLHIFYNPSPAAMFVSTTSELICGPLLRCIAKGETIKKIDPKFLPSLLEGAIRQNYLNVGLQNATGLTGAHPSYKMNMGFGSGTAVRESDGRVFGMGHAMAQFDASKGGEYEFDQDHKKEIQGVATKSRKAWQFSRSLYLEFLAWCDNLTRSLTLRRSSLPGLSFLCRPGLVSEIELEPISIVIDDQLNAIPGILSVDVQEVAVDNDVWMRIDKWELTNSELVCELIWHSIHPPIKLKYSPNGNSSWRVADDRVCSVRSPITGMVKGLKSFLNECPPVLVMPAGGAIIGDIQWETNSDSGPLPYGVLYEMDWSNCDIRKEARPPENGNRYNVQQKVLSLLQDKYLAGGDIVVGDDGSGEIADWIVVCIERRTLMLIHCKFASTDAPSLDIINIKDVLNQCCRSHFWVRRPNFLVEVLNRVKGNSRKGTAIAVGNESQLQAAIDDISENEWKFIVIAAQPGIDVSRVDLREKGNIQVSFLATYEWLRASDAEFQFWGG
jgi:superfamily II DNA or RNA helicase